MRDSDEAVSPESEEAITVKGKAIVTGPTREEFDEHMRTHIPFRNWCEFCVKGKSKADHRKRGSSESHKIGEKGVPTIVIDYTFPKTEKAAVEGERGMSIIVMRNDMDKWRSSFVVPRKGVCEYAVKEVARQIQNAGYNRMRIKSDQEPALK